MGNIKLPRWNPVAWAAFFALALYYKFSTWYNKVQYEREVNKHIKKRRHDTR